MSVGGYGEDIRRTMDWGSREERSCTKKEGRGRMNEARGKTWDDGGKKNGQRVTKTAQRVKRKKTVGWRVESLGMMMYRFSAENQQNIA